MAHALRLAERGLYTTAPNPRVGCVIAHGEEVVGTGFHQRAGEPHAEVYALREAGERARGATAYATLEPCAHHGRTPPCADALIAAGVGRVVVAAEDPFDQVDGRGVSRLRAAGIAVETGLTREAARELNIGFFSRIERGRPFVRVKVAMSLDGRTALANGDSKWITGEAARADVQRWRARSSAILSGSGTVLADNPRLTVRLDSLSPGSAGGEGWGEGAAFEARAPLTQPSPPSKLGGEGFSPLRVILDRQLRTPAGSHVLDGSAPTLLIHGESASSCTDDRFAHIERIALPTPADAFDLHAVLTLLAQRDVNEIHVEAGPRLCGALFAAGLVDELLLYIAPLLLGSEAAPLMHLPGLTDMASRWSLRLLDQRMLGPDIRLRLRPG
jgi:diaminohydroxyphosphoribosylaminopyrimidine deaminase/5-amino-6-(5-phosphoribosylamino)uracil reductase